MEAYYVIILVLILYSPSLYGAADTCLGKIVIELSDDTSDVIDFGYVYVGDTLASRIFIKRTGVNALQIPSDLPPYVRKDITPKSQSVNDLAEFSVRQNAFPVRVSTIESDKIFPIQFIALDDQQFNSGKKEAKLSISLRGDQDTSCIAANRSVFLRATKSFKPLWSNNESLSFDSVYVRPVTPIFDTIRIHNVYKIDTIKADTSSLNLTSRTQSVFTFNPNQTLRYPPKPGFENPFIVRYFPIQRGVDSVLYKFVHPNPYYSKSAPKIDTMSITIYGVGVEQKITIADVLPSTVRLLNDTIKIGSVKTENTDTIKLIIRNDGNIPFNTTSITLTDNSLFKILRPLNQGGKHLEPDKVDTITITFNPVNEGVYQSICTIKSDIDTRVRGVPASVLEQTFVLIGQGIRPRIETLANSVKFDSVLVFDECLWDTTKTVILRNVSGFSSEITSVSIIPSASPFIVNKPPFILLPGASENLDVIFSPKSIGEFTASLQITTKENNIPIGVTLYGKGVEAKSISCELPPQINVFPGHKLALPIVVDRSLIGLTNRFTTTLVYDPSILKYTSFTKTNTATSLVPNKQLMISEKEKGNLTIDIESNQYFISKDTLITLLFSTFLGDNIQTDVVFVSSMFGRSNCESALPVTYKQGIVRLDSLCGLEQKVGNRFTMEYMLHPIIPNPVHNALQIDFNLPIAAICEFTIVNSLGIVVFQSDPISCLKGTNEFKVHSGFLSDGAYSVVMKSNLYLGVQRFVISK